MTANSGRKSVTALCDYVPPAWRLRDIALEFDLDVAATLVRARLVLEQDPQQADVALRLDGVELELLDVHLDGRPLGSDEYRCDAHGLTLPTARGRVIVETRARIHPQTNTSMQGLYLSGADDSGFLLTQCEAEGFRHITWCPDRPDVLARYDVTLRADRARFPVLLAGGNRVGHGDLPDGRHWVRYVDPHNKPSYLFAIVAGRLEQRRERFTTAEGRDVDIVIHAQADAIEQCAWAMECVKLAMRWDEERFGRCYDLDTFHVVATHDFAMGAMENKGLNIFNSRYLLADPEHATDDDYRHVLAVIGHEYFHNWSGNRVTCRDWFQLSLKEGLTVYREQEFESDLSSRTLRRIEDVRGLWRAQFPEDAGPLAHAVRPQQYEEINNFYTATVYEKGAEIVRMLANVLGRDGFRRGLDLYFARHDGDAVTIEDFLRALGDANQRDLQPWLHWYAQAGTPELQADGRYLAQTRCYELTLRQHTAPTPGQDEKRALPIPVAVALFDADGHALPLRLDDETRAGANERVLLLESAQATFRFHDIDAAPTASLLRGYSAPVRLQHAADATARAHLVAHESDGFNRWLAADSLFRSVFGDFLLSPAAAQPQIGRWTDCLRRALADRDADAALHAELLTLPDVDTLSEGRRPLDPEALYQARATLERMLAGHLESELVERYDALRERGHAPDTRIAAQACRRLRNRCLALLVRADPAHLDLARRQFADANILTDRLAALTCLVHHGAADADTALAAFAERYRDAPLVIDKWFAVQATRPDPDALADVQHLVDHPAFTWVNPNKVYALIGAFAQRNPRAFHRADGAGYRFVADAIARLDTITPQVAARLATAFRSWRDLEPQRRAHMRGELERLSAHTGASADLTDILTRSLA